MVQVQALNYLLKSKDTDFLEKLTEDLFPEYLSEYKYIRAHFDRYGTIPDTATFLAEFREFELLDVTEPTSYLLNTLKKDKNIDLVINMYNKLGDYLSKGEYDSAMDLYMNPLQLPSDGDIKYKDLFDPTERYESYLNRCENKEKYFISTGFKELDDAIGGWDAQEELAVIVARPNVGKSQIAIKCATCAAQNGLRVGFYSGEMSSEKVGYRLDTFIKHIPNYALTRGDRCCEVAYTQYVNELPGKYTGKFYILTPMELKRPATVGDLKNFIDDMSLDILFVDQYSLLDDVHHALKENEKFANLSRDLKNLQVQKKIPIICVSQQNRTSTEDSNIIDVSHIAMSDRIGQDATTVLFLTFENGALSICLSKSRDAEKDKIITYSVDWNTGTFTSMDVGHAGEEEVPIFENVEQNGIF